MQNKTVSVAVASELLDLMMALQESSEEETSTIRKYLHKETKKFNEAASVMLEQEFRDDPDNWQDAIRDLHYIGAGLLGLAAAVHRRAKLHVLNRLLTGKPEKGGPTAAEREHIIKGELSDVEGIVTTLEGIQANLSSRYGGFKAVSRKKYE